MRRPILVSSLGLAFALCSSPVWAFLDPPYITPANPTVGELVSVNIYGGGCDLVDGGLVWPPPVTQQGNALTILFTGSHQEDPEFCYYSVGTHTYPVGAYLPGTYVLSVERRYSTFNGWITETLGVIPFTVTGAPPPLPIEAPTLRKVGFVALLLTMIAAALLKLRKHAA